MQKNFLREAVLIVLGKPSESIADFLNSKRHVNEFNIAKKMNLTINQVRNLLYKLSDYGLVSSIRKKDKRKGWYTYFWRIEKIRCLEFLRDSLSKKIDQLSSQLKSRETKRFYICNRCKIEFTEENALLYNFTCNECGDVFAMKDDTKLIKELKKSITKLNNELKEVNEEIEKEEKKKAKQLLKENKQKKKKTKKSIIKKTVSKKNVKKVTKTKKRTIKKRISTKKKSIKKKSTKKKSKGKKK